MALKSNWFISTNQNMSSEHFNENQPYLIQNSHSRIIIDLVFLIEQQTKAEMIPMIVYTMYNICTTQYTTHNVLHMIVLKFWALNLTRILLPWNHSKNQQLLRSWKLFRFRMLRERIDCPKIEKFIELVHQVLHQSTTPKYYTNVPQWRVAKLYSIHQQRQCSLQQSFRSAMYQSVFQFQWNLNLCFSDMLMRMKCSKF